jgi:plasmid stabilization system protein ParE
MNVRFHPLADDEYIEAIDWYLDRSETAAAGFVREIDHAILRIGEAPTRYPVTRFGLRRFVLMKYPFDLVYRILPAEVEIIAVAHHSRKPGYWRGR